MPLRSTEGAPYGFPSLSGAGSSEQLSIKLDRGDCLNRAGKRLPEAAGGQMTRRRSFRGQFLSSEPGASSSATPKDERGGAGVLLHQSSSRSAVVVSAELTVASRLVCASPTSLLMAMLHQTYSLDIRRSGG